MIKPVSLHEAVEMCSAAQLIEGSIFEDGEQYYKVLEIKEIRGRAHYAQVKCMDRNNKILTINYDYSAYDRVRVHYEEDFTWLFSFLLVDKFDRYSKKQITIHAFSKSEAESIFRTKYKKEYSKYFIREVRIEMNQVR